MAASTCALEQSVRKVFLDSDWTIWDILWNHTVPVDHNMIQVMRLISMQDSSQRPTQHYPLIYTQFLSGITQIMHDTSGISIRSMYSVQIRWRKGVNKFPKNLGVISKYWRQKGDMIQVRSWGPKNIGRRGTEISRPVYVGSLMRK